MRSIPHQDTLGQALSTRGSSARESSSYPSPPHSAAYLSVESTLQLSCTKEQRCTLSESRARSLHGEARGSARLPHGATAPSCSSLISSSPRFLPLSELAQSKQLQRGAFGPRGPHIRSMRRVTLPRTLAGSQNSPLSRSLTFPHFSPYWALQLLIYESDRCRLTLPLPLALASLRENCSRQFVCRPGAVGTFLCAHTHTITSN